MAKTFAQYLIDKALPPGMSITRQVDKSYLEELLKGKHVLHRGLYEIQQVCYLVISLKSFARS